MRFPTLLLLTCIAAAFLAGCASPRPLFTEKVRQQFHGEEVSSITFHVATTIDFRSVRELEPPVTKGVFKKDLHHFARLEATDPGKLKSVGDGWVRIDFGRGIVLTFKRRPSDGVYAMAGWGTITIEEERYDIVVGVLSGSDIELMYAPAAG